MEKSLFWSEKADMCNKLCIDPSVSTIRFDSIEGNLSKEQTELFHRATQEIESATAKIIRECYHVGKEKAKGLANELLWAAVNGRQGITEEGKSRQVQTLGDAVKFINDHLPYL